MYAGPAARWRELAGTLPATLWGWFIGSAGFLGAARGRCARGSQWANIGRAFNPPPTMTALSFIFKRNFTEALFGL